MTDHEQQRQLQSLIDNAQIILIIYGDQPSADELAAAGSLHQSLQQTGKDVSLYASRKPRGAQLEAVASATKTEVGNQNLVISFDYSEESVDKVSYHIGEDSNKFYLTIKPKRGFEPLNADNVEFSYTGAEADLILLVGVQQLENLEQLYFGYEDLYRKTPIVTFNTMPSNLGVANFGPNNAALSEAVAALSKNLGLALNAETATNLLRGIEENTNSLQSTDATADTFEIVAYLMRCGGLRQHRSTRQDSPVSQWERAVTESDMQIVQEAQLQSRRQAAEPIQTPNQQSSSQGQRQNRPQQSQNSRSTKQPQPTEQPEQTQQPEETLGQQPPRGVSKK